MNQQNQNWWSRNWKWFVPLGCLGSLVVAAALVVAILSLVFGIMKSSDVYKDAVMKAKAHPAVQTALGSPIEEGLFVAGNINVNGPSGQANLSIPISGPDGEGTLHLVATKSAGQWAYSSLFVEIKQTRQRIDLLE